MKKDEYIKGLTEEAALRGHDVRIRDIAYAILRYKMNAEMAYMIVFGVPEKDNDVECYEKLESTSFLIRSVKKSLEPTIEKDELTDIKSLLQKDSEKSVEGDISFEENKAAMIDLIKRTEDALAEGQIETDKGLKIIADLRVKLNDKFKVSDKEVQQYVIVQPKFNTICQYTNRECWLMTEEWAMKHYHLIKDPKYKK